MGGNGFNLNNGANIVFSDGFDSYGFQFPKTNGPVENRSTGLAVSVVGADSSAFADSTPFKKQPYRDFSGGFGQLDGNTKTGGFGAGGDPTKFLGGNSYTLQAPFLMPGPARNLCYPTLVASPVDDEPEIPRGVVPYQAASPNLYNLFTAANAGTIVGFEVLVYTEGNQAKPISGSLEVRLFDVTANSGVTNFWTLNPGGFLPTPNYMKQKPGFAWIAAMYNSAGPGGQTIHSVVNLIAGHVYKVSVTQSDSIPLGCYISDRSANPTPNAVKPYVRAVYSSTVAPYKQWGYPIQKVERVYNSATSSWVNFAVTTNSVFNADLPTTAERLLSGNVIHSFTFNNQVYVQTDANIMYVWNAADAAAVNAATFTKTSFFSFPNPAIVDATIYFAGSNNALCKWDGTNAGAATTITNNNTIGNPGNNINSLMLYNGLIYVLKPEGVFCIMTRPSAISLTDVPGFIVQQVVAWNDLEHVNNGRWWVQHQGVIYLTVINHVWSLTITNNQGPQVAPVIPPLTLQAPNANEVYCNGLSSDGQYLYASYMNLGVLGYNGKGWHTIAEAYNYNSIDYGTKTYGGGLRVFFDPASKTNQMFFADQKQLCKLPIPSPFQALSTQVKMSGQNRCFYHVFSGFDGDVLEVVKFIKSFTIFAQNSGWCYKIVGSAWLTGDTSPNRTIFRTIQTGLTMTNWSGFPQLSTDFAVNTPFIDDSDFNTQDVTGIYSIKEIDFAVDFLSYPALVTSCVFVLYAWNPLESTYWSQTSTDPNFVKAIVGKYLPVFDYIPSYTVTVLPMQNSTGTATTETATAINADVAWLRNRFLKHSPTRVQFIGADGNVKTIYVFFTKTPIYIAPDPNAAQGIAATDKILLQLASIQAEVA